MSSISSNAAGPLVVSGKEIGITGRREIQPLFAKAREVIKYYHEAVNCTVAVRGRNGFVMGEPSNGLQMDSAVFPKEDSMMQICEFCKKYCHNPSRIWKGNASPCKKVHSGALEECQYRKGVYIYTCPAGFVYWSSPLYRNGHCAGVLTAGQVLSCGRNEAAEKIYGLCNGGIVTEKISLMLENTPEKSHEEIGAMAQLLGICAREISENRGEYSEQMIRRIRFLEDAAKIPKDSAGKAERKNRAAVRETPDDPAYPSEKERMLIAAFRRGDKNSGGKILKELMEDVIAAMPGNFELLRFRAIELMVLLSRAAVLGEEPRQAGGGQREAVDNGRYLKRIQESKTAEELIGNLGIIAECLSGKIFSFRGVRHASVLRKAERYIWKNYDGRIRLEDIAKAAGLSAPYFSSVFKEEMGENLSNYLNRLRVEKAAAMLIKSERSLKEIAGLCGFEDQSWFSKIFKKNTGMSPGKYRETSGRFPRADENKENL